MRLISLAVFAIVASVACGQWLPDDQQKQYRDMWEATGVDFPEGGKFYHLQRVSQRLVTVNDVPSNGIYDDRYRGNENINRQYPWVTPAGLQWSPKEQWTKVALAYFPGEIVVWRETTQVLNSFGFRQPQPRLSWQFPPGTLFAEMLIRRHDGRAWVFEIRERTKDKSGRWESGVTYRPEVPADAKRQDWEVPPGKLSDFGIGRKTVTTWQAPRRIPETQPRLTAVRAVVTADHREGVVPQGYLGNVMRCMTCHQRTGESTSYGATNIPGSDSVISWHPFTLATLNTDAMPQIDYRWPVKLWRR